MKPIKAIGNFIDNRVQDRDVLGAEFGMDFRGRGRHTTFCGGIISIALFLIAGFVTYKYASDFMATDDPDIKIATSYEPGNFPKIDLFNQRLVYAFTLTHYDFGNFVKNDEFGKYVTVHLSVISTFN